MALDLSTLVRAASGALFMLLGIACALLARRAGADRALARGLAAFCVGFGLLFVLVNLNLLTDNRLVVALTYGAVPVGVLATVGIASVTSRALGLVPRERTWLIGVAVAYAIASVVPLVVEFPLYVQTAEVPAAALAPAYAVQLLLRGVSAMSLASGYAFALAASRAKEGRTPLLLLSVGLTIYPATILGFVLNMSEFATNVVPRVVGTLLGLGLVVLWLVLAERSLGRAGVFAALTLAGATLGGMVEGALVEDNLRRYALGVARSLAVALLALAVFRHDLLRARLAPRAADRASRATIGLATLFVVAQVAQNYLSDVYGLVLGGVVAGALLFAASPIQRALERGATTSDAKLAAYRDAVRYALHDGVVTRKEETHLATLAQHLGIGAADALRMRHEVEDERAEVKRNP